MNKIEEINTLSEQILNQQALTDAKQLGLQACTIAVQLAVELETVKSQTPKVDEFWGRVVSGMADFARDKQEKIDHLAAENQYLIQQIAYCGYCQFFKDEDTDGAGYCNLLSKDVNCDDSHHADIAKCFIWKGFKKEREPQ